MKSIMLSIRPEWVEKILNGEKTIEIRKTKPNFKLPIKVYIYETKDKGMFLNCGKRRQKVGGKVVAEFTLNKVTERLHNYISFEEECYNFTDKDVQDAGFETDINGLLDFERFIEDYGKAKPLYAWHISDLKIYDKPKELSEFSQPYAKECRMCVSYTKKHICGCGIANRCLILTRPPQSWCYVEEFGGFNE